MKKTLYIVVLLIVGLMLGSCNKKANTEEADKNKTEKVAKSKEELKKLVKELDEECPYEVMGSSMQSIELKDEEVKITLISDNYSKDVFEMWNKHKKVLSESILNSMSYSFKKDEQLAPLLSKMMEAETGLVIEFKAPTGKKFTIKASADEVKKAKDANAKDVVKSGCKLTNAIVEESGVPINCSIEGNYYVVTMTTDCEDYQKYLQYKELFLSQIREELFSNNDALECLRESGLGIKYIIANADTGEQFVSKIENDEL